MINEKRLIKTFTDLVKIDSESRNEKNVASYIEKKIKKLKLKYKFDNSKKLTGSNVGNLIIYKKNNNSKKFFDLSSRSVSSNKI